MFPKLRRARPGLTMFALLLALPAARGQTRGDFALTKITRELIETPEFTYSGAKLVRTHPRERWLEVDADFSAVPAFTDELTFKYYILLNAQLLTGEVTHVNILGGRELHSSIYLPPNALVHLMGNRTVTINSVQNVAVQIVQQGTVKDELSLTRARPQWFVGLPAVSGFLLNKNETPFAPLFWNYYEQIKPASSR